jgi:hypothetical protein
MRTTFTQGSTSLSADGQTLRHAGPRQPDFLPDMPTAKPLQRRCRRRVGQ